MLLTRKSAAPAASLASRLPAVVVKTMDRRTFLKRSGITLGAGAFAAQLPFSMIGKAQAEAIPGQGKIEIKRTVCTHCSVGCAVDAVVQNGVWVGQEPVFDSPINLGSHCAKGAAVRDHGMTHDSRRLKYPMKLVNGKYQRISWDQALDGITQKMFAIRKESGPDAAYFVGSSKHGNEQAFLLRKFVSLWGTNNCDHQARICHSTTVAGVANTWGYGAMTNSYNDEHNSKALLFLGSNAAEAHPVSMLHTLHAKEHGAKIIVVDPRFTRTAAKADYFYRIRSGTDIPFIYGMLHHIFANGWEDREYIAQRVYGMDKARDEAKKWTPQAVQDVTGMAEEEVRTCAEIMAKNRPSTIIWAMGQTQHTNGNAVVRASCILQLALGNVGVSGGGTNIYRGHDNVQGATDVGPNAGSLPPYYGLTPAARDTPNAAREVSRRPAARQFETEGWCRASNRWLQWRERVIEPLFDSRSDQAIMYAFAQKWGFADQLLGRKGGRQNIRLVKVKNYEEPDLEDVLRNEINRGAWTIGYTGQTPERLQAHMRNMHLFDVQTLRAPGGRDAKTGYDLTGDYFGLPWPCYGTPELKHPGTPNLYDTSKHVMDGGGNFRANFGVERDGVSLLAADGSHSKGSDITTGYPQFDSVLLKKLGWWNELTAREKSEAEGKTGASDLSGGIIRVVMKNHGCSPFGNARARAVVWNFPDPIPVHREALYSPRTDLVAKYPTHDDVKVFWRLPTLFKSIQQKNVADKIAEKFPLILTSGRIVEYEGGGDESRSNPWLAELEQEAYVEINPKAAADRGIRNGEYVWMRTPTGGRLKFKAQITPKVGADTVFVPYSFGGWWQGVDLLPHYPEGSAPFVRGDAINTGTTYGYDRVTMMQETKTTLCQIERA